MIHLRLTEDIDVTEVLWNFIPQRSNLRAIGDVELHGSDFPADLHTRFLVCLFASFGNVLERVCAAREEDEI